MLISDRDRVVAERVPAGTTHAATIPDALLAEAVCTGLPTPAVLPPGRPRPTPPVAPLDEIPRELDEHRGR